MDYFYLKNKDEKQDPDNSFNRDQFFVMNNEQMIESF